MGPHLWHTGGLKSANPTDWVPDVPVESPSGLLAPAVPRGVAMSEEAIADTISAYAKAAADSEVTRLFRRPCATTRASLLDRSTRRPPCLAWG
jgi:hypothetical protein